MINQTKILFLIFMLTLVSCGLETSSQSKKEDGGQNSEALNDRVACPESYSPLCGQPPMPECPAGMGCAQVMPQPKTYSNQCFLDADKARLLYAGECR